MKTILFITIILTIALITGCSQGVAEGFFALIGYGCMMGFVLTGAFCWARLHRTKERRIAEGKEWERHQKALNERRKEMEWHEIAIHVN